MALDVSFLLCASAFAGVEIYPTAAPLIGCLAGGMRPARAGVLAAAAGTSRGSGTDVEERGRRVVTWPG